MKLSIPPLLWRAMVLTLALCATMQLVIELLSSPRTLTLGVAAQPLFSGTFDPVRGPTQFLVARVPAASPLAPAGVQPGDRVRYDEPRGRWLSRVAGDHVALTVTRHGASRRVEVEVPAAPALPRFVTANYAVGVASTLLAILIGLVAGWRLRSSVALRALAAAALLSACVFPDSAPAPAHLLVLDLVSLIASRLGLGVLVFFALNFPDDRPDGWRLRLRRLYTPLFALHAAAVVVFYVQSFGGHFEPAAYWLDRCAELVEPAVFFAAILLARHRASGEIRLRLQWIVATLGVIVAASAMGTLNFRAGQPIDPQALTLGANIAVLGAEVGFFWAVFRHRIVDLGLAVNRALIFAIVGAVVFVVIQLTHQAAEHFLQFDDRLRSVLLSALLAVTAYLSLNPLKRVVERGVDRVFFGRWLEREQALERCVEHLGMASTPAALAAGFVHAVDDFSGCAGCTLFLACEEGYAAADGRLGRLPARVDADDETVLAMRAAGTPQAPSPHSALAGAGLALPLRHRGQLLGFAALGAQPLEAPYRPDQMAALSAAAQQAALDLHALRVEDIERQLAGERRVAETLRAQLATAVQIAREGVAPNSS